MTTLLFSGAGLHPGAVPAIAGENEPLYMRVVNAEVQAGDDGAIAWQRRNALALQGDDAFWVALGDFDGIARFAAIDKGALKAAEPLMFRPARQAGFRSLFQLARCAPAEQRLAARAVHIGAWLHRQRHCSVCGSATHFLTQQNKLVCQEPGCAQAVFPRVDPSVAALVVAGSRCLLARQAAFPKGYFAPLAGFIEPGETPEHTVAREVFEEVGLAGCSSRYVTSQPWPFPGALMLGFIATVQQGQATVLSDELEEAMWIERNELRELVARPGAGKVLLPPANLIGAALIQHWLDEHE